MRHQIALQRQRGATLLISLIMLVILTLFAVAVFNLSSVNLKIAGNFQEQRSMEAVALQALEEVLSTPTAFRKDPPPATQTICVNGAPGTCAGGYNVSITAPKCNYSAPAPGYSLKEYTLVPDNNDWELSASVSDTVTGARATVTQGLRMRMLADNCPS